MSADLKAIQERAERDRATRKQRGQEADTPQSHHDRAALLEHIARLNAGNDGLRRNAEALAQLVTEKDAALARQSEVVRMLTEAGASASYRLNEYRKRCGCLSMAGICPRCTETLRIENGISAALKAAAEGATNNG